MTIWVDTNGRPSKSANLLAKQPGFKRNRTWKHVKDLDLVVNWGSTNMPLKPHTILNHSIFVKDAANKLLAFQDMELSGVHTPAWTTDKEAAAAWNSTVFVRNVLTGHSGHGIVVVPKGDPLPDAPLYVKFVNKVKEFRTHVVNGTVIDTQRKIKDPDREVISWSVRSYANGFIYARNNIEPDEVRDELAVDACTALGLNFGAVDIIQDKEGTYYVLEVNTAPGLEGQTVVKYAEAFREIQG